MLVMRYGDDEGVVSTYRGGALKEREIESIFDRLGLGVTAGQSIYSGAFGVRETPKVEVIVSTTSNPFS